MAKKRIKEILSLYSREQLSLRVRSGVDFNSLSLTYKSYSEEDKETINEYIRKEMKFIYCTKPLGHKTEPYYEKEEDMVIEKYTWETLSDNEKVFYNNNKTKNNE